MAVAQSPQVLVQDAVIESLIPAFNYPSGAAFPWVTVTEGEVVSTGSGGGVILMPSRAKKVKIKREIVTKEIIKEVIKEVPDPQLLLLLYQERELLEQQKERNEMLEDALQAFVLGVI